MYTATAIELATGKTYTAESPDRHAALYNAICDLEQATNALIAHQRLMKATPGNAQWFNGIYIKVDETGHCAQCCHINR